MMLTTLIGGINVTPYQLRDRAMTFSVEVDDTTGRQMVTTGNVSVSNGRGHMAGLLQQRQPVLIHYGGALVFRGSMIQVNSDYMVHQKILTAKVVSEESDVLARMRDKMLGSTPTLEIPLFDLEIRSGLLSSRTRRFFLIHDALARICLEFGIGFIGEPWMFRFACGGSATLVIPGPDPGPAYPQWSCYDFLANVAKTFNCVFSVGLDNVLRVESRNRKLSQPPQFQLSRVLRDSVKLGVRAAGADVVEFFWDGYDDRVDEWNTVGYRLGTGPRITRVVSPFRVAVLDSRGDGYHTFAMIDSLISRPDYLVELGDTPLNSYPIRAGRVVRDFYQYLLSGIDTITATYLLDPASTTPELFSSLVQASFTRFAGVKGPQHLLSAELDWQRRTVEITGAQYANPS